ncbi:MAG: DUF61 family protein [Desulfurococcales archaeon]|jgi:hypothetical protein|nr:DUF61 family protein [Desulfurococcales archaeon]
MEERPEHFIEGIEKKVLDELKSVNDELLFRIALDEAQNSDVELKLRSGESLVLRSNDLEKLRKIIPIEINIIISGDQVIYKINGDLWQVRMVKYIHSKKLRWRPEDELRREELERLIGEFPSLVRLKLIVR